MTASYSPRHHLQPALGLGLNLSPGAHADRSPRRPAQCAARGHLAERVSLSEALGAGNAFLSAQASTNFVRRRALLRSFACTMPVKGPRKAAVTPALKSEASGVIWVAVSASPTLAARPKKQPAKSAMALRARPRLARRTTETAGTAASTATGQKTTAGIKSDATYALCMSSPCQVGTGAK